MWRAYRDEVVVRFRIGNDERQLNLRTFVHLDGPSAIKRSRIRQWIVNTLNSSGVSSQVEKTQIPVNLMKAINLVFHN